MNTDLNMFASAGTPDDLDQQYQQAVEEAALFAEAASIPLPKALANVEVAYRRRRAQMAPQVLLSV